MSLARSAVRGAGATFAGQWGRFVIQLGSTMVLARLLTPADYGLVGMVLAITGLADRIKALGLSTATVQAKEIDRAQHSALFWINAGLGLGVSLLLAACAPLIARFYGEPSLTPIVIALSTAFIFSGVGAQHTALLNRRMSFGTIAKIDIGAMVVGVMVAILAAWLGAGYWALVLLHVIQPIYRAAFAWRYTGWTPGRPSRATGLSTFVRFGANLSVYQIMTYVSRHIDNVLIGRFLGPGQLGIYSKAYGLLLLPIQQIQGPLHRVAIPTLSRLQDAPERFRNFFCTGLGAVTLIVFPLISLLAIVSEEAVLLLLGSQWTAATPIFRILAIAGIAHGVLHSNGWLYIALGRTKQQLRWGFISHPTTVTGFVIGLRWGVEGVASAFAVTTWLLAAPSFWAATRGTPVSMGDVLRVVWRPAVMTLCASMLTVAVRSTLGETPVLFSLLASAAIFAVTFAATAFAWPAAREQVLGLVELVRSAIPSK